MKYSDNNLNILINIISSDKILRNKINIVCYIKIYKIDYKRYIITIIIKIISFSTIKMLLKFPKNYSPLYVA